MVNRRYSFQKVCLFTIASSFAFVNASKNAKSASDKEKIGTSVMNSPEYLTSKNNIEIYMRKNKEGKPLVALAIGSKAMMEMLESMIGLAEIESRLQQLMPAIQKVRAELKSDKDKEDFEKNPDVREYMELLIKGRTLYKQRDEIIEAALELFKSVIFGMNKNALIQVLGAELISSEDAPDENHPMLDAQKLYKFCIMECHARILRENNKGKEQAATKKAPEQLKSTTQKSSGMQKK